VVFLQMSFNTRVSEQLVKVTTNQPE